jgi:rRNA maturation endonuclease Nob1
MKERAGTSGTIVCPNCGEEMQDPNAQSCQSCGHEVLRCSQCGSIITSAGQYCPQCGEQYGQRTTTEPPS